MCSFVNFGCVVGGAMKLLEPMGIGDVWYIDHCCLLLQPGLANCRQVVLDLSRC